MLCTAGILGILPRPTSRLCTARLTNIGVDTLWGATPVVAKPGATMCSRLSAGSASTPPTRAHVRTHAPTHAHTRADGHTRARPRTHNCGRQHPHIFPARTHAPLRGSHRSADWSYAGRANRDTNSTKVRSSFQQYLLARS